MPLGSLTFAQIERSVIFTPTLRSFRKTKDFPSLLKHSNSQLSIFFVAIGFSAFETAS